MGGFLFLPGGFLLGGKLSIDFRGGIFVGGIMT